MKFKIDWQKNHCNMTIDFRVLFSDGSRLDGDISEHEINSVAGASYKREVEIEIQKIIYSYLNRTKDITPTRPVIEHNNNGRLISNE